MFGIAAAHVGAYGGVAAAPKSGQIAGRLDGAMGRRQKFDRQRNLGFVAEPHLGVFDLVAGAEQGFAYAAVSREPSAIGTLVPSPRGR